MMYKGYEIERYVEYTFSNGEECVLYHVKKDGEYIKENFISEIQCKAFINNLLEK